MSTTCAGRPATRLRDGTVLVAAGQRNGYVASTELYDVGLAETEAWRPALTQVSSPLQLGTGLSASGSGFQGRSEASGGNAVQHSASNYPLVQLRRLDNEQMSFLPPDPAHPWSDPAPTARHTAGLFKDTLRSR